MVNIKQFDKIWNSEYIRYNEKTRKWEFDEIEIMENESPEAIVQFEEFKKIMLAENLTGANII